MGTAVCHGRDVVASATRGPCACEGKRCHDEKSQVVAAPSRQIGPGDRMLSRRTRPDLAIVVK